MDQAIQFLRSIQDRARGGLARSERFDAANVVRSCVALERPLALKRSVALQGVITVSGIFLQGEDRKSTRLNSSHMSISYAVFCLKKKKKTNYNQHPHITAIQACS